MPDHPRSGRHHVAWGPGDRDAWPPQPTRDTYLAYRQMRRWLRGNAEVLQAGAGPPAAAVPAAHVGGRPATLARVQLEQAQVIDDRGEQTGAESTAAFGVGRSALDRNPAAQNLAARKDGQGCVYVVYRNTRSGKIDRDTGRRWGETGMGEVEQIKADREWWNIGPPRRTRVKAIAYVLDGVVSRIRGIHPDGQWTEDSRGYIRAPVTAPLSDPTITRLFPTLPLRVGDHLPRVRGKMREYLTL